MGKGMRTRAGNASGRSYNTLYKNPVNQDKRRNCQRLQNSSLPPHEAGELFRLMVEATQETAVYLMDPRAVVTLWNRAAAQMTGYTAEEAVGKHVAFLYTDADQAHDLPTRDMQWATERGFYGEETWRRRKDGGLFFARVAITALRAEAGMLLGFFNLTIDLTQHKLLEQCEREKRQIDLILQAAEAATWRLDASGDRIHTSRQFLELLGYAGSDLSLRFDEWLDFVWPDDRETARAALRRTVTEQSPEPIVEIELRLQCKNSSPRWFFVRAKWQQEAASQPRTLMGVCVDVDHLKQAEHAMEVSFRELDKERSRFSEILEHLPTAVVLAEIPSGKLLYKNPAAEKMLGEELQGTANVRDYASTRFLKNDGTPLTVDEMPLTRTLEGEVCGTDELNYRRDDGSYAQVAVTTAMIFDNDGVPRVAVAAAQDVTSLRMAQRTAASEKERAEVTLAAIADGVMTTDRNGLVQTMNPAAEQLLGVTQEQVRDRCLSEVVRFADPASAPLLLDAIALCCDNRRPVTDLIHATVIDAQNELRAIEHAVAPMALPGGELIGAVLIFHDITESRRLLHRLGFEASHDALTGLVNRREFESRLQRTIEHCKLPQAGTAALLYMDLDQFKIVNDTCGHAAGDDMLRSLAKLYCEQVRERDTLARIGGDEFALILEHCALEEAHAVGGKILGATRGFRFSCKDNMFQPGISIGLTLIDGTTANVEEAMRRADHACYIAKERGRNRIYAHFLGDADFAQRRTDTYWATRISHALEHNELQLYYQPIVALRDGAQQLHYEILLRMRDSDGRPIPPAVFMPAAERYDVIASIDRWVLSTTLQWLGQHPEHVAKLEMCSINLSRRSLGDRSFHQFAAELVDATTVPAEKLCFEITENGAIADMQGTISFIDAMSARGCRFSLDDFGTGMTSFSYLKQLPVDFIKIDGSFIQMMSSSEVDFEMVRFTNDISHMMGRQTIAEYVTDQSIVQKLQTIGVDFAQGYWIGEPRPLETSR
jgi:diguanylate cyclase (GGDEF)-like protein/PAS domain S-box-containing protein